MDRRGDGRKKGKSEGLTPIPQRIHCAATPEGETLSEVDIIAVEQFLDTLAEVAMSVASRRLQKGEG